MCEFGRMNIQRIDSHTTRCTGQPPTVPLHPVIPCFLGTEHQEGGLALLWYQKDTTYVVQKRASWYQKIPHMWYMLQMRVKKDCFQTVLFVF